MPCLGAPYRVALSGNYAYVAEDVAGVEIIDVSNPANLSRVTYYNSPGVAYGVDVVGNYLYVADKSAGLQIVDISTPASPTLVGTHDTAGAAYRVKVVGNYAYIADWTNGLVIVDVSTPASPTLKGSYDTSDNASDIAVVGNYAYVSDQAGGVQIIDISDPAHPSLLTGYDTSGTARSVAVAGSKAFVADTAGGLQVLDWSGMANFASMKSDTVALTVNAAPSDPAPTIKDDGDNIPATTEEKVPTLPATSGATTVAGDGNGDGVADSAQANVTSVPFLKTDTAESAPGDAPPVYVTLVSDSVAGKTDTTQTQTAVLKDIQQLDAPADKPADVDMPLGLISFTADVASAGAQEDFSLYVDSGVLINGYWKQNTTGSWVNLASADYGGRVVSEGGKTRLDFQIVDGGEFDDDGKADGVITDPGAPGWRTVAGSDADNDQFPDALEATYGLTVGSKDNDVFASTKFFVLQLYRDFLFREAETDGLNYWMGQIDAGQLTRTEVASLFLDSTEFQAGVGPLARLYLGAFGRLPDATGMDNWMAARQDGMSLADIAAGFAGSAEFQGRYGALDDAALVAQLYQNLLGRAPEASGAAYWQVQRAAGLSTGDLVLDFTESAEYVARSDRDVTVTLDYVGLLGRTPEQGGFDYWLDRLDHGMPEIAVIGAFMETAEYHDRFLP